MKPVIGRALACVLVAAAGAAPPLPASAQSASPRIGLALSGGGARGLAHIGVLKVLEELRVPVSCVTGTSMGAVVGGTFASGRTPAQMEETVLKTNWDEVFNDRPPRQEVSIRRKADDYKTLFAPELGVKDGLSLPKGIIAGLSIESYFRALVGPTGEIADFGQLPVPFRAMASDIVTGESIVLASGSVSQAMRASMSVPGAVAPVEIGGRLLVDGGISNNLPIDEARKLCNADAVIAVNISTPPLRREEITSALSVSLQLVNLLGKNTVDHQLKNLTPRDVLIEPALGDISAGSFERAKDAIRIGEEAARALADKLKAYSVPQAQYAALREKQTTIKDGLGKVDEIRFEGLRRSNPAVLGALVQSKPGEELDEEKVGRDLRRIYGRGDFESVDYRIVNEAGKRVMLIEPKEKSWGPDYFRIGLGLATDFTSDSQFSVLAQYRKTLLNRLGGEWLTELQVGKDNRLYTEFYQPVEERGRWFVAPNALALKSTRPIYVNGDRVAVYDVSVGKVGVDAGAVLGTWGELRVGPAFQHVKASVDTGSPLLPTLNENSGGMAMRLVGDHLDHAWFPREGHRAILTYYAANKDFGSDRNYQRIEGQALYATSFGAHTVNASVYGGSNLGSSMPAYETFTLGGPLRLSGYRISEFSGQRAWLAKVLYYNRAIKMPEILGSGVYLGGSLEAGKVNDRFDGTTSRQLGSMSAFLAADTFLGPAYFGVGWGGNGRYSVYLVLGVP